MTEIPRVLRDSVANCTLVPFVGAGVSLSVKNRSGKRTFPTWPELLLGGAEELRQDQKPGIANYVESGIKLLEDPNARGGANYIQLAKMIRDNLSGDRWVAFLESALDPAIDSIDKASLDLPKEVWGLNSNFLITTNFDKILTWTCPQPDNVRNLDIDDAAGLAGTLAGKFRRPTIWHLHGYINNPSKLILTSAEYDQLYAPHANDAQQYPAALMTLRSVFASKKILFVGFSFADLYVRQELEWVASTFDRYNGEHFALIHESEVTQASPWLEKLNVRVIPFSDFGPPLLETLRDIAGAKAPPGPAMPFVPLAAAVAPEPDPQPIPIDERWRTTRAVRLMDQLGPTYILDRSYFFLDWNPAFERLFAEPMGLYRGQHAQEFVRQLMNRGAVDARARDVFLPDNLPLVDMEPLFFRSEEFGVIELWKIASRIIDSSGNLEAWCVALDIVRAEKMDALWKELRAVLDARVNWALYAPSYDRLVLNFDDYGALVRLVCSKLNGAVRCADLGAGTGNGTLQLLQQRPDRAVWAVDPNEEMLDRLRRKVSANGAGGERVHFIKQSLRSLGGFDDAFFDGAIMINVLYAVDNPAACLKEVARVMQPGGVLALSTAHSETDVDKLFDAIRRNLAGKGKLEELAETVDEARERHQKMMDKIHRDTKDDIRRYLDEAGFAVADWHDSEYAGAVVVVKAVKR